MKDLPIVLRVLLNIIIYVFYVLVASIVFSFLFPLVLQLFGKEILTPSDPIFAKIQIFIALLVLIVSLILRKHFYITLEDSEEKTQSYTQTKKSPEKKQTQKNKKQTQKSDDADEEIKIYVDKEIK